MKSCYYEQSFAQYSIHYLLGFKISISENNLAGITEIITDSISVRIVILITLFALCAFWGIDTV